MVLISSTNFNDTQMQKKLLCSTNICAVILWHFIEFLCIKRWFVQKGTLPQMLTKWQKYIRIGFRWKLDGWRPLLSTSSCLTKDLFRFFFIQILSAKKRGLRNFHFLSPNLVLQLMWSHCVYSRLEEDKKVITFSWIFLQLKTSTLDNLR